MNIDPVIIDSVKGFLDKEEGMRLYELAVEASKMAPCLEIGSYCGKSTLYLGAGCRATGGILFSIDHHRGSEEQQPGEEYFDPETYDISTGSMNTLPLFRKTLSMGDLEETVIPVVTRSSVAARMWATPLSLVFIDGGHTYEAAFTDYGNWSRHLVPGGYLLIHDIFKDPDDGGQAPYYVYRLAVASGLFDVLPMTRTLGVLRRRECGKMPDVLPEV
jgi:MMP 1-O-methyltransferase